MPPPIQGIIDLAAHPPFGILSRETGFLLAPGLTNIRRIRGLVNVDAFGLAFSFVTIPAAFGRDIQGVTTRYEEKIVQFAPIFTDLGGHNFHADMVDIYEEGLYYYLPDLFPTSIDVWVQIGCTVQQYWLVAL
jgi:hypothetical protein